MLRRQELPRRCCNIVPAQAIGAPDGFSVAGSVHIDSSLYNLASSGIRTLKMSAEVPVRLGAAFHSRN